MFKHTHIHLFLHYILIGYFYIDNDESVRKFRREDIVRSWKGKGRNRNLNHSCLKFSK